jgi:hypothetical protein
MKNKAIRILVLLFVGVLLSGAVFAQKKSQKRAITVQPASRPSSVMGDAKVYVDGINGAVINWETTYELGNLGFTVYSMDAGATQRMVNDSLIGGSVIRVGEKTELNGESYSAYDPYGRADSVYYIESVDMHGKKNVYGPIAPVYTVSIKSEKGYNERLRPDFMGTDPSQIYANHPVEIKAASRKTDVKGIESVTPDPVNQKWVASQPGVKIRVNKAGMYHITKAELQTAGFDVNSTPVNWQLYQNGVERKMIVEATGAYIEFYGAGIDIQNADFQIYYLIAGPTAGARIPEGSRIPIGPFIQGQNFRQSTTYEPRSNYVAAQIINGDLDNWFGPVLTGSGTVSRQVSIKDIDFESPDVTIEIALHGLSTSSHHVRISVNGTFLGILESDGIFPFSKSFSVKASNLMEGANTFEFAPLDGAGDVDLLDYVRIEYWRLYKADQNALTFETQNLQKTLVTGFNTANVRVFELNPDLDNEPLLITNIPVLPGQGGTFDISIPQGRKAEMIAVNENSMLSPVSITQNIPSTLSTITSTADMLIVSHGNFMTESNNWANYRRSQGLTVDVVNVEDVFDEFDYGLPTPDAVKGFLVNYKTNDANLKYVMLAGDASYDPRNYVGLGYNDFIPTKFVDTPFGESPSDEFLGDGDHDAVAEEAIGRMAVRDGASMTLIQGKVQAFEASITNALVNRGALFVADDPIGWDFDAMNHRLRLELPPEMPATFIFVGDNTPAVIRALIISDVNAGPFLVNYAGHGSTRVWSTKQVLRFTPGAPATNDLLGMNNGNDHLSIFLMLTCLNGFFADVSDDSLAEGLVKLPTGGAPTVWASSGSTTPDFQDAMATRFFHLLGQGTYDRLGDATHAAKLEPLSTDVSLTWTILGDPSLKIK